MNPLSEATETHRVIAIRGQRTDAHLAEILIHQLIANQPRLETVVIEVPNDSVGRIIGRGGETIRSLQTQSRCKIDVERGGGDPQGTKRVTLRGTSEQVDRAQTLITEELDQAASLKAKIKVAQDSRHPRTLGIKAHQTPQLFLTSENGVDSETSQLFRPNGMEKTEKLIQSAGDKVMAVYVSSIADPGFFYVQKVGPRSIDLDKLVDEMTAFYEVPANRESNQVKMVSFQGLHLF